MLLVSLDCPFLMMAPMERDSPQHLKNIMKIDVREIKIVNFSLRKGNVLI
jgi:hypothetical protein